jgi:hypothetical protein
VPEWFATISAPPAVGMLDSPMVSTRNHFSYNGFSGGISTFSVRSRSNPNSSIW